MLQRTCIRNRLRIFSKGSAELSYDQAFDFYSPHGEKWFREPMAKQISGKILQFYFIDGPHAIKIIRNLLGPTNPVVAMAKSPGSIRGQFAEGDMKALANDHQVVDNCAHASSSVADGKREIAIIEKARV